MLGGQIKNISVIFLAGTTKNLSNEHKHRGKRGEGERERKGEGEREGEGEEEVEAEGEGRGKGERESERERERKKEGTFCLAAGWKVVVAAGAIKNLSNEYKHRGKGGEGEREGEREREGGEKGDWERERKMEGAYWLSAGWKVVVAATRVIVSTCLEVFFPKEIRGVLYFN